MSDPLGLKKHIREVKDFPIEGINFRDITSLIENPEAFQTTCKELIEVSKNFNASVIASIESRGFIFAGSISFELGLPFVLARKPGKLPNETFKKDFDLYIDNFQNINEIDRAGWVCGLGHGILKETPEENVHYFIENIRKIFS